MSLSRCILRWSAVSAVAVSSAPMPPNSQTRPPTSAEAGYSSFAGASVTWRHFTFTVTGAEGLPDRSSSSDSLLGPTCPASVAPPTAYSESLITATATPWRAVDSGGRCDHLRPLMS